MRTSGCCCKFSEEDHNTGDIVSWCDEHKYLVQQAVEAEREACAKIAEPCMDGMEIAAMIRARGNNI